MKKFLEAIMYALRREPKQPVLPTGSNPLPPLSDFEVKKKQYNLNLQVPYGRYSVEIDLQKEVGFYEHAFLEIRGQFWLAGCMLLESEHLLPGDVRRALGLAAIEVA